MFVFRLSKSISNYVYIQLISDIVNQEHRRLTNIMRKGAFPSLTDIQGMGRKGSRLIPADVEAQFTNDDLELLPAALISEILTEVEECFAEHLLVDGVPMDGFGVKEKRFTDALDNYNKAVLKKIVEWQNEYEDSHGELGIELAGRLAYSMRYDASGNAPLPLLTVSFVSVLDTLFERIPSFIQEVRIYYSFVPLYTFVRTCKTIQIPRCLVQHKAGNILVSTCFLAMPLTVLAVQIHRRPRRRSKPPAPTVHHHRCYPRPCRRRARRVTHPR